MVEWSPASTSFLAKTCGKWRFTLGERRNEVVKDRMYVLPAQVSVGGKEIYLNAGVLPTPTLRTENLREIN